MTVFKSIAGEELSSQISRVWRLSVPAILTQITTIIMQYIDSAMVGALGANASAAIGLVASSTWMVGGVGGAVAAGFAVQVSHHIGAGDTYKARRVLRHGLFGAFAVALLLCILGVASSGVLPRWLGADEVLWRDASAYFLVFSLSLPFHELGRMAASFLQSAGNMVVPSVLNSLMCLLDVVFNAVFIPRFGVLGAALGTALASLCISVVMLWYCCVKYEPLRINRREACPFERAILSRALRIGLPVGAEQVAISGAMVVSTGIIAPLGPVDIAANSFAITAEGLCYMPGFGMAAAAATLVGQSIGAGDKRLARRYGAISAAFGTLLMTFGAVLMFIVCPLVFRLMTPVPEVRETAAAILRIGLLAEPMYGLSLVASGALRGAEDTLVPSVLNLFSIWVVRLGLALLLVGELGIRGMWIAMAVELCFRGLLMLWRLCSSKYLKS